MRNYLHCLLFATFVLTGQARSEDAKPSPVWLDATSLTGQNVVLPLEAGGEVRVDVLGERLFRVRYSKTGKWTESALNRYGILAATFPEVPFEQTQADGVIAIATKQATLTVNSKDGAIALAHADGKPITEQAAPAYETNGGYDLRFTLDKDERLYGLGDVCRDNIMRRGGAYEIWVLNVTSYIPIPVILSNGGWGLLMNTTWRNKIDVGKSDPDRLVCTAARSDLDYYLFCGADYRKLLETYTSLSGRPALLPIWGYGHTYVANQNIDAFNMMNEAVTFRREGIPCDVFGLEPGWMSKHYDFSTEKKWHPERFPIPYWAPKGPHTFFGALKRKGFKLSLWLCCDYDLSLYEEQQVADQRPAAGVKAGDGKPEIDIEKGFIDERLSKPAGAEAKNGTPSKEPAEPSMPEPWFEHLKKFVDQGASAFKLDGSAQVIEHPKREWGNGMTDEEMHNLYPVIYAKQMARGFEEHTKRRAMVYSAGGYAGVQQYVATWAGDTGGGKRPLASMLNLAFSGHSNHSCDMSVTNVEGLHFGFLQTWAQQNNWDYWYQPWHLEDRELDAYRPYARLRYKLLPYLYSSAAEAALTGYPVMRAMPMVYPDDPAWDTAMSQYMLGDFLLVSAFSKEVRVPEGEWFDFFTGTTVTGPATVPAVLAAETGGALLVRRGAIVPTWPPCQHVEKGWSPEVGLLVYPAEHSTFTLHEDDGQSLGYREGKFAHTLLTCETIDKTVKLTVGPRKGSYADMPETRDFTATVHLSREPKTVTLDGEPLDGVSWEAKSEDGAGKATIKIPACGNAPRVLAIQ